MVGVGWIGGDVELLVEPGNATAILRRRVAFAGDVARVAYAWLALADVCQDQPVLPIVAEIVDVGDGGLARRQHLTQADLGGFGARLSVPILIHGQAEPPLAQAELPEMIIKPSHRGLD